MIKRQGGTKAPPSLAVCLWVAVAVALVGFAAVYAMGPGDDNGARAIVLPADRGSLRAEAEIVPTAPTATSPAVKSEAQSLAKGHMAGFVFKTKPEIVPSVAFQDGNGAPKSLKDWSGKIVLLNLWATWCTPCRKEMPALDRLQKELGGDAFEVVALSVDKSGVVGAKTFLDQIKVQNLRVFADPTVRAGAELKVPGLPTTLLIDREGREIGRLVGPAEWDSADAKRLLSAVISTPQGN